MTFSGEFTQTRSWSSPGDNTATPPEEIFRARIRFDMNINMRACHIVGGSGPEKCNLASQEKNLPLPREKKGKGLEMHKLFFIDILLLTV